MVFRRALLLPRPELVGLVLVHLRPWLRRRGLADERMRLLVVVAVLISGGRALHVGTRVFGLLHFGLPRGLAWLLRTIGFHGAIRFRGTRNISLRFLRDVSLGFLRNIALRFSTVRLRSFAEARQCWCFGPDIHRLTLLFEIPARRRWISRRDHAPVFNRGWWMEACRSSCADHAGANRLDRGAVVYWSLGKLASVRTSQIAVDRARVHECVVRDDRDSIIHVLVHVRDVGDMIDGVVVVDVRDLRDVHSRIRDVDAVHISAADAVRRNVDFTRAERKPANTFADSD